METRNQWALSIYIGGGLFQVGMGGCWGRISVSWNIYACFFIIIDVVVVVRCVFVVSKSEDFYNHTFHIFGFFRDNFLLVFVLF